jgi:hypothetical protein
MEKILNNEEKYITIDENNSRIIILEKDFPLYKSILIKYGRNRVFQYKNFEDSSLQKCQSISWFGGEDKAKYYKRDNTEVYKYMIKKNTKLFVTNNIYNLKYFKSLIDQVDNDKLNNFLVLSELDFNDMDTEGKKHFEKYLYLKMTKKQRIIYEYSFAFGLLSTEEQFNFLKLIIKLQEYNYIENLTKMMESDDDSLFLTLKRYGMNIIYKLIPQNWKELFGQRCSLYQIDLNIVQNLCLTMPEDINGYIYLHQPSIWHRKMTDVSEVCIFNPIDVLV